MLILVLGSTCLTNARLPETLRPENNEIMGLGSTTESIWNGNKSEDKEYSDVKPTTDLSNTSSYSLSNNEKSDADFNSLNGSNTVSNNSAGGDGNTNSGNSDGAAVNYSSAGSGSQSNGISGGNDRIESSAIVNGTVYTDDTNSSSASINDTDNNASEGVNISDTENSASNHAIEASSKKLLPGTTFDDVEQSALREYGTQPKYFNVTSGDNSIDVYPNLKNEINLYISSESSDVVTIDIYAGTNPLGRLLLKPRTFNSYTITGLNEEQCYTLKVSMSSDGRIMIY